MALVASGASLLAPQERGTPNSNTSYARWESPHRYYLLAPRARGRFAIALRLERFLPLAPRSAGTPCRISGKE
jgi:hypothetical protein